MKFKLIKKLDLNLNQLKKSGELQIQVGIF